MTVKELLSINEMEPVLFQKKIDELIVTGFIKEAKFVNKGDLEYSVIICGKEITKIIERN